jgi:hypothetical protein
MPVFIKNLGYDFQQKVRWYRANSIHVFDSVYWSKS